MLSSKWGFKGHHKKKKKDEKSLFVKKAGDAFEYNQHVIQKAKAEDVTAGEEGGGGFAVNVAIGGANLYLPLNIPITSQGTGGSINKESGPGNLIDNDDAELDLDIDLL